MRDEISTTLIAEIKEKLRIAKLQAQMKATLIELEDLRNRKMRSTLIFKNITGIQNESWEDTSCLLANFITQLDLPYSCGEIDFQISQAHRSTEQDKDHPKKTQRGPNPIMPNLLTGALPKKSEIA